MRHLHLIATLAFLALPTMAWADHNPDFDDDATPILRMQPGLLQYVEANFEVKDTGTAKYPGNDDRPPRPPFIFPAKPRGAPGPFTLRLLIQPGPRGHILNIVDMTKVHLNGPNGAPPAVANQQPPPSAPTPVPQTPASQPMKSAPAQTAPPASTPSTKEPTADTPSGPITSDSGNGAAPLSPPPPSAPPSLEPPPDPAPPAK